MAYTSRSSPRNPPIISRNHVSRVVNSREDNIDEHDSDSDDGDHECLLYAQKLNNNAALCIDIGYFDKATQSLQKALQFSQKLSDENLSKVCRCTGCKADGGIDFSSDFQRNQKANPKGDSTHTKLRSASRNDSYDSSSEDDDKYNRKRNTSNGKITKLTKSISCPKVQKLLIEHRRMKSAGEKGTNASWSIQDEYCDEELDRNEDDEIYKRPIRVVREGCLMGSTLFLIITFNLALTHHLEVVSNFNHKRYNTKSAKKALLFYDLTSTQETKMMYESHNYWDYISSIRFKTILNSNLDQLLQYLPEKSIPAAQTLLTKILRSIDEAMQRLSGEPLRKSRERRKSKSRTSSKSRKSSNSGKDSLSSGSSRSTERSKSRDCVDSRISPRSKKSSTKSRNVNRSSSSRRSKRQEILHQRSNSQCRS
mmetsp:Transcript_23124/g.54670  ORF Transcript_23124/g.54670 Transcript_23124/m.54670 type:complete len:424 (-) Transcript_23124:71-1342(-)